MITQISQTDLQDEIIKAIRDQLAKGEEIDVFELAVSLDFDQGMKKVMNFLIAGQMTTKADWNKAVKISQTVRELGFYPKTAAEYVAKWIETNKIEVNYQKAMKRTTLPVVEGCVVTAEDRKDPHIDALARIQENIDINTDTLRRDLRIKAGELQLRFSDQQIADAVSEWFDRALAERVTEVYRGVCFGMESKHPDTIAAWDAVCSQFDLTEHDAKFVEAVLKKFIWQVKRKMIGLPISNHLMPVLTGRQGVGKSTFVRDYLLHPIDELVSNTDFQSIEEVRNTEQWRNYVLFLDEMGYAGKADIDNVKNKITAPYVTGRPMRSNDNVQYKQNATFIGCSNKELNQLIRDETGNRRFVSLRYAAKPDWSKLPPKDQVWRLWRSVNENGEDPSLAIADQLKVAQAAVREKSVVEQWLEDYQVPVAFHGKKRQSKDWYPDFKSWAEEFTSGRIIDLAMFGKEFNRLIKAGQVVDWEVSSLNGRSAYRYK